MKYVRPCKISGTVRAPSSKSDAQRAIAAAALSFGQSVIDQVDPCQDTQAAVGIAQALGASVRQTGDQLIVRGGLNSPSTVLDCRESGLCLRMFTPIAALSDRSVLVTGHGSLLRRPVRALQSALQQLGVACLSLNGFPPISVKGPLRYGRVIVDGESSSQHISGLLFALPMLGGDSEIVVTNPKSKPYIRMTLAVLETFGVHIESNESLTSFWIRKGQRFQALQYSVEGDWSAAAFLLVAGAIAGSVTVEHLNPASLQADRAILDVLRECGAEVLIQEDRVHVRKRKLSSFQVDASDMPDLIPPLAALACHCEGTSIISGSDRLKEKESDRSRALVGELSLMGAHIADRNNSLEIAGGPLEGGNVQAHNDHRIAMATAVAALASRRGVVLEESSCVSKSYPNFFDDLEQLGGNR